MKIVLIGYMASGKSVIGKKLSEKFDIEFIDLDAFIEKREQKTITTIFNEKGEIYFRLQETKYLTELLTSDKNFILSLGGGTPCYGNNMDIILKKTTSFYLKTSIKTLHSRLISEKNSRPLVAAISDDDLEEFIAKHLFERSFFYQKSNHAIITDNLSIQETVDKIAIT